MPATALFRTWSAELDRAEELGGAVENLELAIEIVLRVHQEAESERDNSRPGRWDDGGWEECTVVMTRAAVLLLRLRRPRSSSPPAAPDV